MQSRFILLCSCLAFASPAAATGGFNCSIDDKDLQFEASAALGASLGAPILNLAAQAKPKIKGTPKDMRDLDLKSDMVHSWMNHPDLRLQFYREREGNVPHATFNLVIETKAMGDEISSDGHYQMEIFYTEPPADPSEGVYLKASGKVHCEVE